MTTTHSTYCRICEAACGLNVRTEQDQVVDITPNADHVVSKGYACIKGMSMHRFRDTPDRITQPLKRVNGELVPISWEQALREIGAKLRATRDAGGPGSVGVYMGNPISLSFLPSIFINGLVAGLDGRLYHTGSQDCNNKFVAAEHLYGSAQSQTFPDVDNTRLLIAVGSNPAISKMSFINLPHPMDRIKGIVERGGRVVWVNPRRTESARACGEQLFIRPDTDVFFMLAFLHEVFAQQGVKRDHVAAHMDGLEAVEALARDWSPERVAIVTGIEAAAMRQLVSDYLSADGAALYCSTGVNQGTNGTIAFWIQEVINAITGNLDRTGGTRMGLGLVDIAKLSSRQPKDTRRTRVGDLPNVMGTFPTGVMADEILTPGPGQLRALMVFAGNPELTCANSERMADALGTLDLLVCVDLVRNETARHAHYILPGTHQLERPDLPFAFFSLMGLMPKPYVQYTDAVLPIKGEARDELRIVSDLCRAAGGHLFGSRLAQKVIDLCYWREERGGTPVHQRLLGWIARLTGQGGLAALRRFPNGKPLPARPAGDYLGKRVATPNGRLQLSPPALLALTNRLAPGYQRELAQRDALKLISKRERFSHNSWAHNDSAFVKGERHTNYLYMHPHDARQRRIVDGMQVEVSNAVGRVSLPVKLTEDMMPGAVALPHGWGHQQADGLSVARNTSGANVNVLAQDGPEALEPLSGMAHMNGIVVEVAPVAEVAAQAG